jgi:hypothetical protein
MFMQHVPAAWICSKDKQLDIQHYHAAWKCSIDMHQGNATCTWSIDMHQRMQHGLEAWD